MEISPDPDLRETPTPWCGCCGRASSAAILALRFHAGLAGGQTHEHEFLGVVEELGSDVSGLKPGDVMVAPFEWADNTCCSSA
jgi:threonine dehydrogenase-like Zn-dependent dehydrogenase